VKLTAWDRFTMALAPRWTLDRVRARVTAENLGRFYDAAQPGRRTSGWNRSRGDADSVNAVAVRELRILARNLIRNNAYAKRAQEVIANNTVGWGITPRPSGKDATANAKAMELWKTWADTTECDSEGRSTFSGMLSQSMKTIVSDGEILIRRRVRRPSDGLSLPLQLEILEPDFLDSNKAGIAPSGGTIIQGVEFDQIGRRAAYWIFPEHPGSSSAITGVSRRVPATDVLHCFLPTRPGSTRGVSWFGAAIVTLSDLDEYEDAELMKHKIAACFGAFISDIDGRAAPIGTADTTDDTIEAFEPGMIANLPAGKAVTFATPPTLTSDSLPTRNLRKVAAALGIGYEELTGDYSQVNLEQAGAANLRRCLAVGDGSRGSLRAVARGTARGLDRVPSSDDRARQRGSGLPAPASRWDDHA
jgi:lambda family phage portal protein